MAYNKNDKKSTKKNSPLNSNTSSKAINSKYQKYFFTFVYAVILLVAFGAPFFRGLFFENEQMITEIMVFIAFAVFCFNKIVLKQRVVLKSSLEYASLGLLLVYLITILIAASSYAAVSQFVEYAMYFSLLIMVSDLMKTLKSRVIMLWTLVAAGTGISVIGIDAASGGHVVKVLNAIFANLGVPSALGLKDMFFDLFRVDRIYSTMQYPNALAAYLMCVFFISIVLSFVSTKVWVRLIAAATSFIMFTTFILTLSRGAYLIFPIAVIILLVLTPKANRIRISTYIISTALPAAAVAIMFQSYIANPSENVGIKWLLIVIGLICACALVLLFDFVSKWLEKISWKVYAGVIGAFVLAGIAAVIYVTNTAVPLAISHTAGQKDGEISVTKKVALKENGSYKLRLSVDAKADAEKPNAYNIKIINATESDILFGGGEVLASIDGKVTKGEESQEIDFKVPEKSRVVQIVFSNTYAGTSVKFSNANIIDNASGKNAKSMILKYKYIPESIASRLEEISSAGSAIHRQVIYKDGLKIFKDHWLLGAGGGAWEALYSHYQSYLYGSSEAHNYFLQAAVEVGSIGLIIIVILLLGIIFVLGLTRRKASAESNIDTILQAGIFAAIAAVFMHSTIDFDLSYMSIFLTIWVLIGTLNSWYKNSEKTEDRKFRFEGINKLLDRVESIHQLKLRPMIVLVITLLVLILPFMALVSKGNGEKGKQAYDKDDYATALNYYEKANSYAFCKPEYRVNYAKLIVKDKQVANQNLTVANASVSKAERQSKNNYSVLGQIGEYYLFTGKIDKGLECYDRAAELKPLSPIIWENRINAYYQVARFYLKGKNFELGNKYMDFALGMLNEAKEINKQNMSPFIFTSKTMEAIEEMRYMKENLDFKNDTGIDANTIDSIGNRILLISYPDIDINGDGIPDQWSSADTKMISIKDENRVLAVKVNSQDRQQITSRGLNFLPGKVYTIQMELEGDSSFNNIPFIISGNKNSTGELVKAGNVFTGEIEVPEGFVADNNTISLSLVGDNKIKDFRIFEK